MNQELQSPVLYLNEHLAASTYPLPPIKDEFKEKKNKVIVKVGMLGDSGIGKTSLMVKYIEDKYDEDYIETLGVNFMEKTIELKNVKVTISIWDLGDHMHSIEFRHIQSSAEVWIYHVIHSQIWIPMKFLDIDGVECGADGCVAESTVFRLYGDRHLQGYYRLHYAPGDDVYTLYVWN